jgi:hypothetical protein
MYELGGRSIAAASRHGPYVGMRKLPFIPLVLAAMAMALLLACSTPGARGADADVTVARKWAVRLTACAATAYGAACVERDGGGLQ